MSTTMFRRRLGAVTAAAGLLITAGTASADASIAQPSQQARDCRPSLSPGNQTVKVSFGGAEQATQVFVPPTDKDRRLPLVLDLHGSGSNGSLQARVSGLAAVAAKEGFVVINPTAAIAIPPSDPRLNGASWAWNIPGVPTTAGGVPDKDARDDVKFLAAVIDQIGAATCADQDRVFATGYSGGARMASTLACRIPERIAAIAPVAGLRAGRPAPADPSVPELQDCTPKKAVPVLTFHGDADTVNPYPGSEDLRWGYSTPLATQTWARLNGCRLGPVQLRVAEHVTRTTYTHCRAKADVQLYKVAGGGHTWPGSDLPTGEVITQEIEASELMWDFFESHPRRH